MFPYDQDEIDNLIKQNNAEHTTDNLTAEIQAKWERLRSVDAALVTLATKGSFMPYEEVNSFIIKAFGHLRVETDILRKMEKDLATRLDKPDMFKRPGGF